METQPSLPQLDKDKEKKIDTFLIQVHQVKLKDYIAKGIICPDKYLGNENERDTQSKNKNFLIISNGYIDKLDDTQLLLEVILTNDEKNNLNQNRDIYLLDKPLPISRIKTIYCQNKKDIGKDFIASLLAYQSGYISEKLFKNFPKGKNKFNHCSFNPSQEIEYKEYKEELLKYNKIMGLFAFIKNTNLYYANKSHIYSNYSDNYFEFYDSKNNLINIKNWISKKFYITEVGKKFINKIHTEEYIDKNFLEEIIKIIDNNSIKESFQELISDPLSKKRILKSLEDEGIYYFICLLYINGKKGSNAIDILKDNIEEEIPFNKAEDSLALLGLYYGYNKFKAYEEINIEDKYYQKIEKTQKTNIKFKLDSKLDYNLIEAIYQYAFNKNKEKVEFSYLNSIDIKSTSKKLPDNKEFKQWYKIQKDKVYDVDIITLEKQNFKDIINQKMSNYKEQIEAKYKIFSFVYEKYNDLIEYDIKSKGKRKLYFERNIFIEKIKNETDIKIQNKLLEHLEYDKKL